MRVVKIHLFDSDKKFVGVVDLNQNSFITRIFNELNNSIGYGSMYLSCNFAGYYFKQFTADGFVKHRYVNSFGVIESAIIP